MEKDNFITFIVILTQGSFTKIYYIIIKRKEIQNESDLLQTKIQNKSYLNLHLVSCSSYLPKPAKINIKDKIKF